MVESGRIGNMNQTKKALEKAIECLKQYAADDDNAGMNGAGCYSYPDDVVEEWIKEIRKIENSPNIGMKTVFSGIEFTNVVKGKVEK